MSNEIYYRMSNGEIETIKKNIVESLENITKNYDIDYEIANLNFFLEKYSNVFFEYSDVIFSSFLKYFEKIRNCSDIIKKQNDKNEKFCKTYLLKNYIPKNITDIVFNNLFKKSNILCEKDIDNLLKSKSGVKIIEIYLENGYKFGKNETLCIFNNLGECYIYELYVIIKKLINEKCDSFYCDREILEYASFIPLEDFVFYNIKKKKRITENTKKNILSYCENEELLDYLIENFLDNETINLITDDIFFSAVKSLNPDLIIKILNKKIEIKKDIIDKFVVFLKTLGEKNNKFYFEKNAYLYCEKYNDNNIFPRKLKNNFTIQNIIDIFTNYGYVFNNDDVLKTFGSNIIIEKINNVNYEDEFKKKFLNMCVKKNYYPYFDNDKYPPPDIQCLYEECKKKSNLITIKKICDNLIHPDINCLRFACSVSNNLNVIKYFVDKKKIVPDIVCLQNVFENKNIFLTDTNKIENFVLNNGTSTMRYLYKKISF